MTNLHNVCKININNVVYELRMSSCARFDWRGSIARVWSSGRRQQTESGRWVVAIRGRGDGDGDGVGAPLTGNEGRVGGHAADADGHPEAALERRRLAHHKRALLLRQQRRDHCRIIYL